MCLGGVVLLVLLAVLFYPVIREKRVARFWALGMLLALIPPCATGPMNRQLFFVGIGVMGLLAEYLTRVFSGHLRHRWSLIRRIPTMILAVLFVLIHVVLAPLGLYVFTKYPMGPKHILQSYHVRPGLDSSVEK